jgi:hypothetical protein
VEESEILPKNPKYLCVDAGGLCWCWKTLISESEKQRRVLGLRASLRPAQDQDQMPDLQWLLPFCNSPANFRTITLVLSRSNLVLHLYFEKVLSFFLGVVGN